MPYTHTIVVRRLNEGKDLYPALEVSAPALKVERGTNSGPGDSVIWVGLEDAVIRFPKDKDGTPFTVSEFVLPMKQPATLRSDAEFKVFRYTVSWKRDKHVQLDPHIEVASPPPS